MYIGKAVKMELEDPLEEVYAPLHKRSKHSPPQKQQSLGYNPLDEPSPLGLRLRKSPSLLELIQMKLSESSSTKANGKHGKKNQKSSGADEKLKASNFPASVLKIGTWEYKSRYEGDLVAKCYFAKHKLVWEVLDGGLKNKIEIQWSDIMALKATYPDDGPGTLDVVLIRPPLFYRETNPQPRKHTLWQATSDFTNGQASVHRRHYMQCPQGLLGKHFEKLVQCDPRLNFLSKQPEITIESLYFEPRIPVFEESNEINNNFEVNNLESPISFNLLNTNSASRAQSSSSKSEQDPIGRSPSSVMDSGGMEESKGWKDKSKWENIVVPGLPTSMSMSDLVSHLEERISHHGNGTSLSNEERQSLDILEDISRCLFSDTQNMNTPVSDEKSLMSRVNSLCSLLNKDPVSENKVEMNYQDDVSVSCRNKKNSSMSRIDSVGELLLNLPRIASLPRFLFNIGD